MSHRVRKTCFPDKRDTTENYDLVQSRDDLVQNTCSSVTKRAQDFAMISRIPFYDLSHLQLAMKIVFMLPMLLKVVVPYSSFAAGGKRRSKRSNTFSS
jgi:hypothetical protein